MVGTAVAVTTRTAGMIKTLLEEEEAVVEVVVVLLGFTKDEATAVATHMEGAAGGMAEAVQGEEVEAMVCPWKLV
jgi:hypothetical protein